MVRIAIAQINSCVGDLEKNAQEIISCIRRAKTKKVDLIVFPELALIGYPPEDLLLKSHLIDRNIKLLTSISKECKGLTAFIGFVNKEKGKIYNSCAVIQDGKIADVYHKTYLPNYGVFDEKRYFQRGANFSVYKYKDYNFTVTICEDIWEKKHIELLKKKKLDFLINIAASPFHLGKVRLREKILSQAAKSLGCFVIYCNLVGGQDELVFDGTSKIISAEGKLIQSGSRFAEDFFIFNFDQRKQYSDHAIFIKEEEEAFSALRLGLYDYVTKNGFRKVVVGVSGGIDSAVVLSLARITLGKENVRALIMPSRFTSKETLRDAKKLCENLGVRQYVVNIDDVFQSYLKNFKSFFKGYANDNTEENLQARIRGNILMAFSNKFGLLVLNTGNKSEVSCGYCTLYGDMVGGFGILKDVPKLLVYKLAHYINKLMGKRAIPASVIKRPPSAELKPDQRDTDTLPPYKLLDPILKLYIEADLSVDEIIKKGYEEDLVRRVIKMVDANEYKRRQAPVGIRITPKAFGKDRRMPITNKFSQ